MMKGSIEQNRFKCKTCEITFKHRTHLSRHVIAKHTNKKFECQKCGKNLQRADALANHTKICKNEIVKHLSETESIWNRIEPTWTHPVEQDTQIELDNQPVDQTESQIKHELLPPYRDQIHDITTHQRGLSHDFPWVIPMKRSVILSQLRQC